MPEFTITADPELDIGMAIGSASSGKKFISFEGCHDIADGPISGKQRYFLLLEPDDILWMIESLAKELPSVLQDEAIASIEVLNHTQKHSSPNSDKW